MEHHETPHSPQFRFLPFLIVFGLLQAQSQSPAIQETVQAVSLDSLVTTVRVLSGEAGSRNGGTTDTIRSRSVRDEGMRALAADYLERKLRVFGLAPQRHEYALSWGPRGTNVVAEQLGEVYPLQKYILCAHYDTGLLGDGSGSPGADDNASGCAAVLEAARVLSRYRTAYSILYAFWDGEEEGRLGSSIYAKAARARGDSICGVINLDMIGYDGNGDGHVSFRPGSLEESLEFAISLSQLCRTFDLGLIPDTTLAGGLSDHLSFDRQQYRAVLQIEAPGDFNPFYESSADRLEHFNLPCFHNQAKLAAASIAYLARIQGALAVAPVQQVPKGFSLEQNYPNPFNPSTTIRFSLPQRSHLTITIFNTLGQQAAELVNGEMDAGQHEVRFDAHTLTSGVYFYQLRTGSFAATKTMLVIK